jgi:hypothetical protein
MTLHYLAGGSYVDIAMAYSVSVSTFYYIDDTVSDINNCLKLKFPWNDRERLEKISEGFTRGRSPLHDCVGALDGIAIKIVEASSSDVDNSVTYYNRKGSFGLCVQAVCDSDYRSTFSSTLCPGSTHDSVAFAASKLSRFLERPADIGLPK